MQFPAGAHINERGGIIPFVTQRMGEEPAPANLVILRDPQGRRHRLFYCDEDPLDRPVKGVLWARVSFRTDRHGAPTGAPLWKFMHPYRQMAVMLAGRCQVCAQPARTRLGYLFMAGPGTQIPEEPVLMSQPPVCARHVRTTARLCPHMEGQPLVLATGNAPLYGVVGSVYGRRGGEVVVTEQPLEPIPFGNPRMPLVLASQLVRRLVGFRVMTVDQVAAELSGRAPAGK
jgi:hypothetical protein